MIFKQLYNGEMTEFNGFNSPSDKIALSLAMEKLRKHSGLRDEIGIDPQSAGKHFVHDRDGSFWDVIAFETTENWRESPHLTLGVGREYVSAMVTLPNRAPVKIYWNMLIGLGEGGFRCMADKVLENMRPVLSDCPGMQPRLRIWQRYGKPRNAPLRVDAVIDVDLRTLDGDQSSGVKSQPEGAGAAFDVLKNKKSRANIELQIGARFPYRTCPVIAEPHALNFVAKAWVACKPYVDVLFGAEDAPAP